MKVALIIVLILIAAAVYWREGYSNAIVPVSGPGLKTETHWHDGRGQRFAHTLAPNYSAPIDESEDTWQTSAPMINHHLKATFSRE